MSACFVCRVCRHSYLGVLPREHGYDAVMIKIDWPRAMLILFAFLLIITPTTFSQSDTGTAIGHKLRSHIEQEVLPKLKPFFPKAQTKLDQNGTLIILTCAKNLGPMMLRKIQPEIESHFYSA